MPDTEDRGKVAFTSLDEAFEASLRTLLAGPSLPAGRAGPGDDLEGAILAFLRDAHGLAPFDAAPVETGAVRGLRAVGRRLHVTHTYHRALVTLLARLHERLAASEARCDELVRGASAFDTLLADVVARLWGDYNHLVRVVLDHHVNAVFAQTDERVAQALGSTQGVAQRTAELAESVRAEQRRVTEWLEQLTAAERALEERVADVEGPQDRMASSVAELVGGAGRDDALRRRVEALEDAVAALVRGARARGVAAVGALLATLRGATAEAVHEALATLAQVSPII